MNNERIQRLVANASGRRTRLAVVIAILSWNAILYLIGAWTPITDPAQSRRDASGFSADKAPKFHYFHYYLGAFPLATLNEDLDYSKAGATREIEHRGQDLIMEYQHWSRLGENARIFAYLPGAWLKGSAEAPSIRLFNGLWFTAALLSLYLGFFRAGRPLLALVLAFVVAATPFYWFEVYSRENIFGLLGSVFFLVLGMHAPSLAGRSPSWWVALLTAGLSGLLIAFCTEVRNETIVVMMSLVAMLLFVPRISWLQRGGTILLALLAFSFGRTSIQDHFDRQWERTAELVEAHGGHVHKGPRISGHRIWHPIFCGLGDFGADKGYAWNDRVAYAYALPILEEEFGIRVKWSGGFGTDDHYDEAGLYYVKFDEIEEYEEIVKGKVLADVNTDPGWYLAILIQRIGRILTVTLPFAYAGWTVIPLSLYLFRGRLWFHLRLLLVSLPLSITPFAIYSGEGATYNSVFPILAVAIILGDLLSRSTRIEPHTVPAR
ncbi:MAG: hypothetical protein IPK99_00970 [Flavobacteriales bacterium]|nr:hypothetical protein [Flavobacteriales bacterium]